MLILAFSESIYDLHEGYPGLNVATYLVSLSSDAYLYIVRLVWVQRGAIIIMLNLETGSG